MSANDGRYRWRVKEAFNAGHLRQFHRLVAGDLTSALVGQPIDRQPLAKALTAYLKRLGAPKEALAQAALLADNNSKVVITGQQAGLLTGPAYTIYKAMTAINLAKQIDSAVAVFWIASQDHDSDEIRSVKLLDLEEKLFDLHLNLPKGLPIGRINLQNEWLNQLNQELSGFVGPFKEEFRAKIAALADVNGSHSDCLWSDWFAKLLLNWLGRFGLVVIDPMAPEIAPLFADSLRRELENPLAGPQMIEKAGQELAALGFKPQLHRAPGATNLFLEGLDGQRRLLTFDGKRFLAEREYHPQELEKIIDDQPSRLTPAAGLRPILQDALFGSNVLVLGPGELAYHLQLLGIYELHNLKQPLLWPRMSVTWLEPPIVRILKKYGLEAAQYASDPDQTLEKMFLEQSGLKDSLAQKIMALEKIFQSLQSELEITLAAAATRSEQRILFQIERLKTKIAKAMIRQENLIGHHFDRLQRHLAPGQPQERFYGFASYFLKFGPQLFERLRHLEPSGDHWLMID